MNKIVTVAIALLLSTGLYAGNAGKSMYAGISTSLINFGGSYSNSLGNSVDVDLVDSPIEIEVGLLQSRDNRWGVYYKNDNLVAADSNVDGLDFTTFGIGGQIGFSSLKNDKALPFFSYGIGYGSAPDFVDKSVLEIDFAVGLNYSIEQFEISASLYRRSVAIYDSYVSEIFVVNGLSVGANIKF